MQHPLSRKALEVLLHRWLRLSPSLPKICRPSLHRGHRGPTLASLGQDSLAYHLRWQALQPPGYLTSEWRVLPRVPHIVAGASACCRPLCMQQLRSFVTAVNESCGGAGQRSAMARPRGVALAGSQTKQSSNLPNVQHQQQQCSCSRRLRLADGESKRAGLPGVKSRCC